MRLAADSLKIPPHDAAPGSFLFLPPQREEAVEWARQHLADIVHHSDADLIRACRTLMSNSPADFCRASELLAVLKVAA